MGDKRVSLVPRLRIKVCLIKNGGDGRQDAYKYLAQLAVSKLKRL